MANYLKDIWNKLVGTQQTPPPPTPAPKANPPTYGSVRKQTGEVGRFAVIGDEEEVAKSKATMGPHHSQPPYTKGKRFCDARKKA